MIDALAATTSQESHPGRYSMLYNIEAEKWLLSSILQVPDAYLAVAPILKPNDFYLIHHEQIYRAMQACANRNVAPSPITVDDELQRRNQFEEIGGFNKISELLTETFYPEWAYDYAVVIRDCAIRRRVAEIGGTMIANSHDGSRSLADLMSGTRNQLDLIDIPDMGTRLFTLEDLAKLPPTLWLFAGEIPEQAFTVLYGASGSGKSFIALDYAMRTAIAHPDAGVVYIAPEGGSGYHARASAWIEQHQCKQPPSNIYFRLEALSMLDDGAVDAFISQIRLLKPKLIIFDTLARCMVGGDENSAKDMGRFIDACERVRRRTGATILVVHHTGKSGASERGSSALRAACDMMLEVTNDDGLISLSCAKSKDSRPFEPRYLRMVEICDSCVLLPASKVTQRDSKMSQNQRKILELLSLNIFSDTGAKLTDIRNGTSLVDATLFRALSSLKGRGYLTQDSKGDPYYLTQAGRTAMMPAGDSHDSHESPKESSSPDQKSLHRQSENGTLTPDLASQQQTSVANSHLDLAHQNGQLSQLSPDSHQLSENHVTLSLSLSPPFKGESERESEVIEVNSNIPEHNASVHLNHCDGQKGESRQGTIHSSPAKHNLPIPSSDSPSEQESHTQQRESHAIDASPDRIRDSQEPACPSRGQQDVSHMSVDWPDIITTGHHQAAQTQDGLIINSPDQNDLSHHQQHADGVDTVQSDGACEDQLADFFSSRDPAQLRAGLDLAQRLTDPERREVWMEMFRQQLHE